MSAFETRLISNKSQNALGAKPMGCLSRLLMPILTLAILISLASQLSGVSYGCTLVEDVNNDGIVDSTDVALTVVAFGSDPCHARWNPEADVVADGEIDIFDIVQVITMVGTTHEPKLSVSVDICPKTLNLRSKGRWITAYVKFLGNYNIHNVEISDVKLNGTIPAKVKRLDVENNVLMVKFSRAAVECYILKTTCVRDKFTKIALTVSGQLNGASFVATDFIRIIMPCHCY